MCLVAPLLELAVTVLRAPGLEEVTRCAALNLVSAAVEYKRKLVVKQKLVGGVVAALYAALAEASELADDDDDDSLEKRAASSMHLLATSLPANPHAKGSKG